eukprot:TRINITY_DN8231_c0_g2_i1.p1 TRINITY_DN8231_c0_g2~~TRINITY_DN8231_c0_g2_i1.p1  ORF type:complete len:568 (-),score=133.39 TRINITY_DN8231_c0_g2_i1:16-1719(-)
MGASGAGKTLLLDVLTQRAVGWTGEVRANGQPLTPKLAHHLSGYMMQQEVLMGSLTVQETLEFNAMLRLPKSMPTAEKLQRVEHVLQEIRLTSVRDTRIGNDNIRGVSGGERRRVCIAIELINKPSVLFLDEPTSGLDSSTSYTVMEILVHLAKSGRTIATTIHQPRAAIFNMFDFLLLLSKGRVVFFGPVRNCIEYFNSIEYPISPLHNPADFVVDLITPGNSPLPGVPALTADEIQKLPDRFMAHQLYKDAMGKIDSIPFSLLATHHSKLAEREGYFGQVKLLMKRARTNSVRDPLEARARLLQNIFTAVLVGLIFLQLDFGQSAIQGRVGVLASAVTGVIMSASGGTVQVFPLERKIVNRERQSSVYTIEAYYLSKVLIDTFNYTIFAFLYCVVLYWMTNLNPKVENFFFFFFIVWVTMNFAQSLGMTIGAYSPTVGIGLVFTPLIMLVFLLFSGFYQNIRDIPIFLRWICYINPVRYLLESAYINEFYGENFHCHESELIGVSPHSRCPYETGEQILEMFFSTNSEKRKWIGVLVGCVWLLACRILTFVALKTQDAKLNRRRH